MTAVDVDSGGIDMGASTNQLLDTKKSWWSARTGLERWLVVGIVGLAGTLMLVGGLAVNSNIISGEMDTYSHTGRDVCNTPECAIAAVSVIERMDMTAEPCEDFYRFACGGWMDSNEIPDGRSKWGIFYELRNQVDNALKAVVESTSPADTVAVTSLKDMFSGCMDTETIESSGLGLVLAQAGPEGTHGGWPMVQDSWDNTKFDYSMAAGNARRNLNLNVLLSIWVYLDDFDTSHNTIYIDQPDLALPLSMYLDLDSYADYITAYKTFMVASASVIARELGSQVSNLDLIQKAEEVFEFERQLALVMTPSSERRNSTAMYNPMLVSELKETYAGLDWDSYFTAAFTDTGISVTDTERIIVVQPDYFLATQDISVSEEVVANYMFWRGVMTLSADLTQEMRDIAFAYTSVLSGVTSPPPRWQTCVSKSVGAFGFAAAHEYIKENFEESAKAQADGMVEDLRSAFKELVEETDWMDEETQVKAMTKADLMLQLIGYPDWLPDPEKVDGYYEMAPPSNADDHLGNVIHMKGWGASQDLITLRDDPERDIWLMHPAIVNAWYSPNHNTITFPAGILQPPFFKGGWPRFLNYGAMGMVIGHEITHGFDDQGRQYDGTGSVSPWWSDSTLEEFTGKAQCFIDQYGNYSIPELVDILGEEDAHLNGKLTQGENIADNGGLHEAFRAYMRSVESQGEEPALPGLTDYSSEQMFFIANAQVWCEIQTPGSLLGQVLGDPHSPGEFRVLGPLSNSEDFQREYGCPADSAMNRPEKCTLW